MHGSKAGTTHPRPGSQRNRTLATALLACALFHAPGTAAAVLPPTGDLRETFAADPRRNASWAITGAWSWDEAAGTLVSSATRSGSAIWAPAGSYTGSLRARVKLIAGAAGAPPQARVIFAQDPDTGASRFVQLTAGAPGSVSLAQFGTIRGRPAGTIRTAAVNVPLRSWLDLEVVVGEKARVTVKLGGQTLFTETVTPLAPGRIGFAARASKVAFDRVFFTAVPDSEPCAECHAGATRPEGAANVYAYWDGGWWDRRRGGSPDVQQGGHGDPGGKFAMNCTGGAGCHDMRLPSPTHHRNGVHEPTARPTVNPWHMRTGFIDTNPSNPWDVQMTFDDYCATACHEGFGVTDMRHQGLAAGRPYLQLGYGLTDPTGKSVPPGFPLDEDLTTAAGRGEPLFGTCVTCHDPHGSGATDTSRDSNHMVRVNWKTEGGLCLICHV